MDASRWPDGADPLFVPVGDAHLMWTGDWELDDALEAEPDLGGVATPKRCLCQLCERNVLA